MAKDSFPADMDPEISALLGTAGASNDPLPDFNDIFGLSSDDAGSSSEGSSSSDTEGTLGSAGFPQITNRFEEKGHEFFNDPNYYKNVLSNEGEIAQRVHGLLQKYLTTKDPKDRSVFRQQLMSPYWEFLFSVARKAAGKLPPNKKFLLRFGILHPTFINSQTREYFSKVVTENTLEQPIYYMDEWLSNIGTGKMRPSTTDEVRISRQNPQSKLMALLEKATGKLDGARSIVKQLDRSRNEIENILRDRVNILYERNPLRELSDVNDVLTERQKLAISEIQNLLKDMLKNDHNLDLGIRDFISAEADVQTLTDKLEAEGGSVTVDLGALDTELDTIRQMA